MCPHDVDETAKVERKITLTVKRARPEAVHETADDLRLNKRLVAKCPTLGTTSKDRQSPEAAPSKALAGSNSQNSNASVSGSDEEGEIRSNTISPVEKEKGTIEAKSIEQEEESTNNNQNVKVEAGEGHSGEHRSAAEGARNTKLARKSPNRLTRREEEHLPLRRSQRRLSMENTLKRSVSNERISGGVGIEYRPSMESEQEIGTPKGLSMSSPKEQLLCERCGKVYKHKSCLIKHRWEHSEAWGMTKKWCGSKHQQVQMLEAAQVLFEFSVSEAMNKSFVLKDELIEVTELKGLQMEMDLGERAALQSSHPMEASFPEKRRGRKRKSTFDNVSTTSTPTSFS